MYRAAGREVDSSLHLFVLPLDTWSGNAQGGLAYDHIASYKPAPNGAFWLDRYSLVILGGHAEKLKYGYLGLAWTDTHGALRTYEFSIYAGGRYPIWGPFFVDGRLTLPLAGMIIGAAAAPGSIFEYEAALGVGNDNAAFKVGIHYLNVPADPVNGQPYDFTRRWVFAGFSLAY